jgi:hypothetical protein
VEAHVCALASADLLAAGEPAPALKAKAVAIGARAMAAAIVQRATRQPARLHAHQGIGRAYELRICRQNERADSHWNESMTWQARSALVCNRH